MRFLVIDEHPLVREALEGVLRRQFPAAEISAVGSHDEAQESVRRRPADLILTDMMCGAPEDLKALPALVEAAAPGRVVVFGKCAGRAGARRIQATGVHGYVPATSRAELVGAAVGLVLAGGVYFPQVPAQDRRVHDAGRPLVERLSARQREVLRGLQAGQSNKLIARAMGISVATVKLHVQAILRETGARNRTEAVAIAAEQTQDSEL